jgi:phage gp36-like protein
MSYCTQTDLETVSAAEFLQLADRDQDGEADAAVVAEAIARADGIIDSYARRRYAVPLAADPAIRDCAVKLVWYTLQETNPTEAAQQNREAALKFLRDLSAGTSQLGPEQSLPGALISVDLPAVEAPDRVFDDTTMAGY